MRSGWGAARRAERDEAGRRELARPRPEKPSELRPVDLEALVNSLAPPLDPRQGTGGRLLGGSAARSASSPELTSRSVLGPSSDWPRQVGPVVVEDVRPEPSRRARFGSGGREIARGLRLARSAFWTARLPDLPVWPCSFRSSAPAVTSRLTISVNSCRCCSSWPPPAGRPSPGRSS